VSRWTIVHARAFNVADGRGREVLDDGYCAHPVTMLDGLKTGVVDMWASYIRSTVAHVTGAAGKIAFDKFHVAKASGGRG